MMKVCGIIFFVLLTKSVFCSKEEKVIGSTLRQQLDQEYRNSLCCTKKMRCCKRQTPPNIELRAVLTWCPDPPAGSCETQKIVINSEGEQNMNSFDQEEPTRRWVVTKCHKKIVLTIKIKNSGDTNTKSQFIVVDHVYDPVTSKTFKLLNPYVLKLKQEHVSRAYPLKFLSFVNSEARERVYNKHDGNYTGCRTDPKTATCGVVKYKGKIVTYSQGFCCSCDAQKNAERQPEAGSEAEPMKIEKIEPVHLFDSVECPSTRTKQKSKTKECTTRGSIGQSRRFKSKDGKKQIYYVNEATRTAKDDDYLEKIEGETVNPFRSDFHQYFTIKDQRFSAERHTLEYNESHEKTRMDKFRLNKIPPGNNPVEYKLLKSKEAKDKALGYNLTEPDLQMILQDASRISLVALQDYYRKHKVAGRDGNEDRVNRQVQSSGVQKRGGQNCADRYTPPHVNPQAYHESTHCLRFSPVWYGVHRIEKPLLQQEIIIQAFEKYQSGNGRTRWKDITNGKKVRLGTFSPSYQDEIPTISFNYQHTSDDSESCLDYEKYRLLIPEGTRENNHPETAGGPEEYLLVNKKKIVLNGGQCDVVGVGFQAFYMQPNRCSMPRGTCLHHQPKHMWLHDKKMERLNKPGCYFLKYYGTLASNPIRKNVCNNEKFLLLNYYGQHESVIEMEINADFNAVLRTPAPAVITEVYTDSTSGTKTYVIVKVTNSGLLSSSFYVGIADCPFKSDGEFRGVKSRLVVIAPQNQHTFRLVLKADVNAGTFYCSVEANNIKNELVALRRIRIQKFDRCICSWHCLCACIGSRQGLKCIPMEIEHYHAAGFLGGLPVVSYVRHFTTPADDVLILIFYVLLFILFTLFMLGLTKALIGVCCLPVGLWGLNILLDLPKPMCMYYERNLRGHPVVYDDEGWPVHPDTKKRVRNIPRIVEFCANVIFFYTYPCIILLLVFKKLCCPFYTYESETLDSATRNVSVCTRGCGSEFCVHTYPMRAKTKKLKDEEDKGEKVKKKHTIKICVKPSSEDIEISDNPFYNSNTSKSSTSSRSKKNTKSLK